MGASDHGVPNLPALSPGERFWMPISTGCAAHTSLSRALISGICEVVERDAIALTWLQQLALPEIDTDALPESLAEYWRRTRTSQVRTRLFNATSDLGISTIYSVDISPANRKLMANVGCVTDLDPVRAAGKIHYESTSCRYALMGAQEPPADPDAFIEVWHGGAYMGRPEHIGAFRFLMDSPDRCLGTGNPVVQ